MQRRIELIFLGLMYGAFLLLIFRLVDLQIIQGSNFRSLAESNRLFTRPVLADRGVIKDRYQQLLAWNERIYYQLKDTSSLFSPKTLINRDQAMSLLATDSGAVTTAAERHYQYPQALAPVLGYVAEASRDDLNQDRSLDPGTLVGRAGLEQINQASLRGVDGKEVEEVDALAKKQRFVKKIDEKSGLNVDTTLDSDLSQLAYEAMGDQQGAVIITNADNGEILTMVSKPSYDPNLLSQANSLDKNFRDQTLANWFNDPRKLFFNRALSGVYPPGSIFKLVTALAGLENKAITAQTSVKDEGVLKVGTYEYGNWFFRQYGRVEGDISLVRAIARSNDIFFYKVAELTGPDKIAELAKFLGLGAKVGVELPGESLGLVPNPAWKEKAIGEKWFLGDTYHFGIGQGDLLVTPLQMAQVTQVIANRGQKCTLHLLSDTRPNCQELALSDEDLSLVLQGMLQVCNSGGTSFPFFNYNAARFNPSSSVWDNLNNGAVACKTGTAEFGAQDNQGYRATHGWWTGIININDIGKNQIAKDIDKSLTVDRDKWLNLAKKYGFPKRITITVLVESDGTNKFKEGSRDAAPVGLKIVNWLTGDGAKMAADDHLGE